MSDLIDEDRNIFNVVVLIVQNTFILDGADVGACHEIQYQDNY